MRTFHYVTGIICFALTFHVFASEDLSSSRRARFGFPFYTIGRFTNDVCTGNNQLTGTCVVRGECKDDGGIAAGDCNKTTKQAVCCIYQKACDTKTSLNNTYFFNTGYPSTYAGGGRCSIVIEPCDESICQLRIDFMALSLAPPSAAGECATDLLTITGGASHVPNICGENSKQHVYVDFNGKSPITISVATSSTYSFNRQWQMQIAQIPCNSPTKAPPGCLQYFLDNTGTVSSFNYGSASSPFTNLMGLPGSRQIANQNYGICVRMGANRCSITWSQVSSDPFSFTMTSDLGVVDSGLLGSPLLQETSCTTDYIIIPNPIQNGMNLPTDRFCGLNLVATTSAAKPFVLYVNHDSNEELDSGNRGLYLQYSQNLCPII